MDLSLGVLKTAASPLTALPPLPPAVEMLPADGLLPDAAALGASSSASATAGPESPFEAILSEAVTRVENYRAEADGAVGRFLRGEDQEVHKVALAVQESEIAMELFLQAKNKVVQAYQEIMRMQL